MTFAQNTRLLNATRPIPYLKPVTAQVRQPNERLLSILARPGWTWSDDDAAYVDAAERGEG